MKPTRLLFSPLAEVQILEAFNSYRLSSPKTAQNWMNAVDDCFTAIEHFPLSFSVLFDDVHRAKVKNFPFLLLFQVSEADEQREALIVACVHERSDPQSWRVDD